MLRKFRGRQFCLTNCLVLRYSSEDWSARAFRLEGSGSGVPFGMGNPNDFEERDSGETVLSDELFCSGAICSKSSSPRTFLWGLDSAITKHELEHTQQQADIRQEAYSTMTITTIVLAQNSRVRCDRTLDVDTDSTSDSSDSWFCSKARTATVATTPST